MEGEASLSCESFCFVYMFILENELVVTRGGQREGVIVSEFGTDMYPLLYLKWITNKDLLYNQGTLLKVMWQPGWEGSIGWNGYMYMYD